MLNFLWEKMVRFPFQHALKEKKRICTFFFFFFSWKIHNAIDYTFSLIVEHIFQKQKILKWWGNWNFFKGSFRFDCIEHWYTDNPYLIHIKGKQFNYSLSFWHLKFKYFKVYFSSVNWLLTKKKKILYVHISWH